MDIRYNLYYLLARRGKIWIIMRLFDFKQILYIMNLINIEKLRSASRAFCFQSLEILLTINDKFMEIVHNISSWINSKRVNNIENIDKKYRYFITNAIISKLSKIYHNFNQYSTSHIKMLI